MKTFIPFCLAWFLTACGPSEKDLRKMSATETYPFDNYLKNETRKKAMVIVAHDDDDCAMSGTLALLNSFGWEIRHMSLTAFELADGMTDHPSALITDGHFELLDDEHYRNGLDTTKVAYWPVSTSRYDAMFETEKVSRAIVQKVRAFDPSVIFTLDDSIGGYGHPDHVFLSGLVLRLAIADSIRPERIYQGVYTDHMEHQIMDLWLAERLKKWGFPNTYEAAKKIYGVKGMPAPDVQIDIRSQSEAKMNYLRSYSEEARNALRKFIPYFEEVDHETYFGIFDREFFRVIEISRADSLIITRPD